MNGTATAPEPVDRPRPARFILALRSALPHRMLVALVAFAALAASWFRVPVAAGCELYLGTFFALMVYRSAGVVSGALAAAAFLAPSIWWWGHPYSVVFAVAVIVALPWLERQLGSLTLAVVAFHVVVGVPFAFLVIRSQFDAALPTILLLEARKLTNDGISAALVTLLTQRYAIDIVALRAERRRMISLADLVTGASALMVLLAFGYLLIAEALEVPPNIDTDERAMITVIAGDLGRTGLSGGVQRRMVAPVQGAAPVAVVVTSSRRDLDHVAPALLGCRATTQRGPAGDRTTLTYWFRNCAVARLQVGTRTAHIAFSNAPFVEAAHWRALRRMGSDICLLMVALLLQLWLSRQISRSAAIWQAAFEQFGTSRLSMPPVMPFGEIAQPMEHFVSAHNNYTATRARLENLLNSVRQLETAINLKLARNVEIAHDGAVLSFLDLLAPDEPPSILTIDVAGRAGLRQVRDRSDVLVEFRIQGQSSEDWYLLVAQEGDGQGGWQSGCILQLRQAKVLRDSMFHQARLIDLGGMASALSHELKQPLFTISLAAENAGFALAQRNDESLRSVQARIARIHEQVDRARQIIEQISSYSRIDSYDHERFDLNDAVLNAARFMRPMMTDQNVGLAISNLVSGPARVQMPRVGLEQVLVNALQNAVDAIVARRGEDHPDLAGCVEVTLSGHDSSYALVIGDNGTGFHADLGQSAFDAFVTTKPRGQGTGLGLYVARQVVMEVGGRLAISNRPKPARGALLTIELQAARDDAPAKEAENAGPPPNCAN